MRDTVGVVLPGLLSGDSGIAVDFALVSVIETLRKVLGPEVDFDDTRLELESLKRLEVIVALENEFDTHIPEDAPLARITSSVDAIVAYLSKLC